MAETHPSALGTSGAAATVTGFVTQINSLLPVVVGIIGAIKAVVASAKAANVTIIFDQSTGKVYANEQDALADGAVKEDLKQQVPEDAVLIASMLRSSGLLGKDLSDARKWLRDSGLLPADTPL